jgi:hypothetical protein
MTVDLINEYLSYITKDHHKSRDMTFIIQKVWSYGEFKGYRVVHEGYVNEEVSDYFETYQLAEQHLNKTLQSWIKEEKEVEYD